MECRKNKRNTHNALAFEMDLVQNLWQLHDELNSRTYKIGRSICFLTTSPKLREGLDFLGYLIRPNYVLTRKKVK